MMNLSSEHKQARGDLLLARAWFEKGRDDLALSHLQHALELSPEQPQILRYLAFIHTRAENFSVALDFMRQAYELNPGDPLLRWEMEQLQALAGKQPLADLPDNIGGKLRFRERYDRQHHRSGWRYAVNGLYSLHHSNGVRFEDFIEDPFAWQQQHEGIRSGEDIVAAIRSQDLTRGLNAEEKRLLPIREPWTGVFHNPHNMPPWFHPGDSPQAIMSRKVWRDSLDTCVGLFTLSEYSAHWLREQTGKPVSTLVHPTEIPDKLFEMEAFLDNQDKRIVQIGWWLRRLSAIYELPVSTDNPMGYRKLRLVPHFIGNADQYLKTFVEREMQDLTPDRLTARDNTEEIQHISDTDYDRLLSQNIVFVQLYDASANNTVVECLARGTPLLVNPLPAVKEYLGEDYPLYYKSLEQAAGLAMDRGALHAANQHLMANPLRQKLSAEAFKQQLENSEVYQLL